jgi:hypothetical protein
MIIILEERLRSHKHWYCILDIYSVHIEYSANAGSRRNLIVREMRDVLRIN